jgi:hypothetical protein
MRKLKWFLLVVVVLVIVSMVFAKKSIKMLKDGAQAYMYGYSLVLMDTTNKVMTNRNNGYAPVNHFSLIRKFPDPLFREVVRPNCDTLYATVWFDLSAEPIILSVPDMGGRYYVMPFMDAWTNVFAYVGTRTTGSGPGHYLVTGPDWKGTVPEGIKIIQPPTNMTWLIGRIQTNGKKDYANVHQLQDQLALTPLSRWQTGPPHPAFIKKTDPSQTSATNAMVAAMDTTAFFSTLARLMGEQPPAAADAVMLKTMAEFGVVPGKPFDLKTLGFLRRLMLTKALEVTRGKLDKITESDRSSENKWAVIREGIGDYGTNYSVRALVSMIGLGALEPAEAAYPNADMDGQGQPFSGNHHYRIHFDAGKTPPVDAFWSLTIYDERGFLIDNPIKRYALGDRDPLVFNPDGSLDILIQHELPKTNVSNWLPTPAGAFAVTLRLYLPKTEFLDGTWKLPPIERIKDTL